MAQETGSKTSRRRRIAGGIAKAFVALIVIAFLVRSIWSVVAVGQMRRAINAIPAAGDPLTFDDLDALVPQLDPKDDAARQYAAALSLFLEHDTQRLRNECHKIRQGWPPSKPSDGFLEDTATVLEENRQCLEFLDEGSRVAGCRFDQHARNGISGPLFVNSKARYCMQLLSLRTCYLSFQDMGIEARDSIVSAFKFCRIFDYEPVCSSYLCQLACLSLACGDTAGLLELTELDDASLASLQAVIEEYDRPEMFGRCLRAERVLTIAANRYMVSGVTEASAIRKQLRTQTFMADLSRQAGFWGRPMLQSSLAGLFADFAEVIRISDKPWPDQLDAYKSFVPGSSLGSIVVPPFESASRMTAKATAEIRATAAAVMTERYQLANGRYPHSLKDLVPAYMDAVPVDPFTGDGLLYKLGDGFYAIYSTGEDREDNGGEVGGGSKSKDWGVKIRFGNE